MPYSADRDRATIGVRESTREQLRDEKGDDETWDEVLLRLRGQAKHGVAIVVEDSE